MAVVGTACRTRHPAPSRPGRVDAAVQGETRIAAEGFVQSGRTSYSRMYKPCLLSPPAPAYGVLCRSKCAGGVCGLWPGSPVRSKSAGPFSNSASCFQATLALPVGEVRRWPCKQWGQFRISPDPLFDKIPGHRLAPSLISHGWISGFTLAGCPGEGRLLPGAEGSHLQR